MFPCKKTANITITITKGVGLYQQTAKIKKIKDLLFMRFELTKNTA